MSPTNGKKRNTSIDGMNGQQSYNQKGKRKTLLQRKEGRVVGRWGRKKGPSDHS